MPNIANRNAKVIFGTPRLPAAVAALALGLSFAGRPSLMPGEAIMKSSARRIGLMTGVGIVAAAMFTVAGTPAYADHDVEHEVQNL